MFSVNQSLQNQSKRVLVIVKFSPRSGTFLHGDMFSIYQANSRVDIPSFSELLFNLSPFFRSCKECQITFLEFSNDGPADDKEELTYGGLFKSGLYGYPVLLSALSSLVKAA